VIDFDALVRPIDDNQPAGPDLEYSSVAELDRFSAGTPGTVDPSTQELAGAEEPNWRKVAEQATELLGKTKDLRVAAWLTRAELANRGLPGLADGLKLIAMLVENFWETLYPPLDRDEGDDPIERLNVLANLSPDPASFSAEAILRTLRGTVIVESREVGRFTLRDLEFVLGRMSPPAGQTVPPEGLLVAAWKTGDPAANQAKRDGISIGLAAIQAITKLFADHSGQRPNLDLLQQTIKRVGDFYAKQDAEAAAEAGDGADNGEDGAEGESGELGGAGGTGGKPPRSGGLASRADAVRILQQVATFLRKAEPSSPAPMFVDRAIKLLQMDFNAIVKELMPDSQDRIEMLGGISLDEPESS
jgi:type VI secretion system protein ImpA